jgi:hypothetical protein
MDDVAERIANALDGYQRDWESRCDTDESVRNEVLTGIATLRATYQHVALSEFRQLLRHKMAQGDSVSPFEDWWWGEPTNPLMMTMFRELNVHVENALRRPAWKRKLALSWSVAKELIFLSIVVALILTSNNRFERRVVSLIVLIYTYIGLEAGRLGFALTGFELSMGYVIGRIARQMRIKWDDLQERDAVNEGMPMTFALPTLALYIARFLGLLGLAFSFF